MIECKNITKVYGKGDNETLALDDVSFTIKKGEFVAIMGPSGSGKSTLMNILGALDRPTKGSYFLDGKDVSTLKEDELAEIRQNKIGFVFQSFNLLSRTSIIRNVTLPLVYDEVPHKERLFRVQKVLRIVGIPEDRWHHHSNQLSGGQIQRVAIARALINEPSIILADEPTGNLDTKTGHKILEFFSQLNKESGHTIILITHEDDVATYAQRVITIRDGKIVADILQE
ncbi:MAG: ABC transporter ATP-binding protein [Candidatus Moraniibacteriota bacterium]|nr:MAG: ABC transporter ATP-binding protein [Candidatus Moranbacteria bacterium]